MRTEVTLLIAAALLAGCAAEKMVAEGPPVYGQATIEERAGDIIRIKTSTSGAAEVNQHLVCKAGEHARKTGFTHMQGPANGSWREFMRDGQRVQVADAVFQLYDEPPVPTEGAVLRSTDQALSFCPG